MSVPALTLKDKMAKLSTAFAAQLPKRLAEARSCFQVISVHSQDRDAAARLHLILHSMNGTGNSLGFREIGALAARGEQCSKQLIEKISAQIGEPSTASPELMADLQQCLERLQTAADQLTGRALTPVSTGPTVKFEMPEMRSGIEGRTEKLIYICDDEALHLELLAGQLLCFGYHTELFNNTSDLRAAVQRERPAVLIMDIMFPGDSFEGTDVLADLRNQGNLFPVVFVSVRKDFEARLNAIRAGGQAYFPKPVNVMELVAMLDSLIGQNKPEPFRILIVDDEPEMALYVSLILEQAEMLTKIVNAPELVLEAVSHFRPDLVLMDMYMPTCSGPEVAKLIRQIPDFLSLPIVFLSSETDKMKQYSAMSIGADGFLTKPIAAEELVQSVSLRADRMRTLRALMARDSLTSLFNHTTTTQLLENALQTARRLGTSLSFAMLDLDNFKAVNDSYGHPVGDQVLLGLARVLRQRLRKSDLVGRYGGEEFAVILHDINPDKAHQIMEQLRDYFSRVVFNAGETRFSCTFSCGIASFPAMDDLESLREAADAALYQAKKLGRNQIQSFEKKPSVPL